MGLALLTARLGVALAVRAGAVTLPLAWVAVCEVRANALAAMPATPTTATAAVTTGAPAATAGRRRMDRLLWAVLSAFLSAAKSFLPEQYALHGKINPNLGVIPARRPSERLTRGA